MENQISAAGKDVVIIGGGDTGADCLGTAIRQGARSITQLEIMPTPPEERPSHQPWPTYPMTYRVSSAHEEAGERVYSVSTSEFVGDETGTVSSLRLVEVVFEAGKVTPIEGTEREVPAQLVLLAMGFTGPERETVVSQLGVSLDERGNVARDEDYATDVDGRLRLWGRRPRSVADRVGHRRGSGLRGRGRRIPVRVDEAAPADPTVGPPADGLSQRRAGPTSERADEPTPRPSATP